MTQDQFTISGTIQKSILVKNDPKALYHSLKKECHVTIQVFFKNKNNTKQTK